MQRICHISVIDNYHGIANGEHICGLFAKVAEIILRPIIGFYVYFCPGMESCEDGIFYRILSIGYRSYT